MKNFSKKQIIACMLLRKREETDMYFYFPSSDYCMMLDRLKASLNEEQWEAYRRAHPDLMKIYREQGEEGNTVVVGYRFK